MKYAVIVNGKVSSVATSDTPPLDQACDAIVDVTNTACAVGDRWLPNGTFSSVPAAPPETQMSKLAFLRRITQAERIAIRAARATDPVIEDAEQLMSLADVIDVSDPDTIEYVGYLVQKGLLTQERATEVLATP